MPDTPALSPPAAVSDERRWPAWFAFAALAAAFLGAQVLVAVLVGAAGVDTNEDLPAGISLAAALIQEAAFVGTALLFASLVKRPHPWQFGLRGTQFWPAVGWTAAAVVCFYVLAAIYVAAVGSPEQSTADDIGADNSQLATVGAGVLFVVIAPVAEEFFFRGFLYGALRSRLRVPLAALAGGVVFGSLHVFTGLEAVPLLIAMGVILCLLYERTQSLYPCIAFHALNNALAYGGQTDAAPELALGFGAAMLVACAVVPRFAWRRPAAAGAPEGVL